MRSEMMVDSAQTLEPFVHQWTVRLTTYRRDGTPVGTPVNIAVDSDRAFIRTFDTAGKLKRIRNNPEVEIAPSTFGGKSIGPAVRARARVLSGEESVYAGQIIAHKYPIVQGIFIPLAHRLGGYETRHIELMPVAN